MLEKTVLQQLQEIFPMEVNREEADAGENHAISFQFGIRE